MKTPREILSERHGSAGPKLDAIRRAVMGELNNKETKEQRMAAGFGAWCLGFPNKLWSGLTAVWALIVVVNVSQRDNVSSVTGQPVHSSPVMMSWQVQQRLMNEVLADRMTPPEADRPRNDMPRPRTETDEMEAA
jgi:hypothetical protein